MINLLKNKFLCALGVVAAMTFISFFPSLGNGWTTWDDNEYVTDNPVVQNISWANVKQVLTTPYLGSYLPLTMISYMLDYSIDGYNAAVFHRTNLIIHILNACLVFWFAYLLSENIFASCIVALLFGIHPMRVESVAWISGRKDVLSMFFFLLSSIGYLLHLQKEKSYWLTLSFVLFVCAISSKIIVLTFPIVLLLYDLFKKRDMTLISAMEKIPFLLVAVAFTVIGFIGQTGVGALKKTENIVENIIVSLHGIIFYVEKFILPVNLSNMYPYPAVLTIQYYFYAMICIVIFLLIWKYRKNQVLIFGFLFFVISLLPVLQFVRFSNIFAADRFTYFAYIGLFYIIGIYVAKAWTLFNKKTVLILLLGVVMTCSYVTWERCGVWKDSTTLWKDMFSKYPEWMKNS